MGEEQIRMALSGYDAETLKDALAILLAGGGVSARVQETSDRGRVIDSADFKNFAEAISYLKSKYKFQELNNFSTEADLVYVDTGDRKILLTKHQEAKRETGRRFENLAYETEDDFFANAWENEVKSKKKPEQSPSRAPGVAFDETPLSDSSPVASRKDEDVSSSRKEDDSADSGAGGKSGNGGGKGGRWGMLEL